MTKNAQVNGSQLSVGSGWRSRREVFTEYLGQAWPVRRQSYHPGVVHTLPYFILLSILESKYYCAHFVDEEAEPLKISVTFQKSHVSSNWQIWTQASLIPRPMGHLICSLTDQPFNQWLFFLSCLVFPNRNWEQLSKPQAFCLLIPGEERGWTLKFVFSFHKAGTHLHVGM